MPLLDKLASIVGAEHVLTGVELSPYVVEGRTPEAAVFPGAVDEVAAVITQAAEAGVPVVPWGGGSAVGVGVPPARAGVVLHLGRLAALVEHEPGDLTATAQSGITLAALQAALRARGQWLSLDPADAARATLGGVLAANASGPRRHLYGTARDVLIGVTVVTGEGTVVRGGGKVVKNVAGYDLPKLFVGSYGTLGVIVEATVKLRPLPDEERLVGVRFERLKDAGAAVRALLASDLIPNAVDLVDGAAAAALGLPAAPATLAVGFDGLGEQVDWQVAELASVVGPCGGSAPVPLPPATWEGLASAPRAAFDAAAATMTLSVLPAVVADTMEQGAGAARQRGLASAWCAHAGVGHVTATLRAEGPRQDPAPVAAVLEDWRAAARAGGGHASLTWAPLPVKSALAVWDDAGAAGRLMQRIKAQLDPGNVLNPGRFVSGI
ncbi:MAG TPA: FAD-binding oxidoreductase [Methylomirabilota bacterium]|nr:FAD-binding oxidoreductase [Methylomirabilota bacterium]